MRNQHSRAFWLRLALPALVLLITAIAPVLSFDYEYEQDVQVDRSVAALRCTEIYLPKTIKIEWEYADLNPSVPATFEVRRRVGNTYTTLGTTTNNYWVDSFEWTWDTQYKYYVRVSQDSEPMQYERTIPPMTDPALIYDRKVASGSPNTIHIAVTPKYLLAAANQTVDSRYDLRYSTYVHKDFNFGSRIYRGGLFAGYVSGPDGSRVARSFVGFSIDQLDPDLYYWTGSLNAYHTRNAKESATSAATIGVHEVSDSWTESGTVWSNAPSLTPGSSINSQSVSWNPSSPVSSWKHFNLREHFGLNLLGDGLVTFGLAATDDDANPPTNAFAYFAKSQWDSAYGPRMVYALGTHSMPLELTASPSTISDGSTSTGTVYLNGFRTIASNVGLSSSNPSVASVTSNVAVDAYAISKTFTITTYNVTGASVPVTITATRNGFSETMVITVTDD